MNSLSSKILFLICSLIFLPLCGAGPVIDARNGSLKTIGAGKTDFDGPIALYRYEEPGKEPENSSELADTVLSMTGKLPGELRIQCRNRIFPELEIEKVYRQAGDGSISRELIFKSTGMDGLWSWQEGVSVSEGNMPERFARFGVGIRQSVDRQMMLAVWRDRVNDRYVMRRKFQLENSNRAKMPVMSDFLSDGRAIGGRVKLCIQPCDWGAFFDWLNRDPDWLKTFGHTPEWTRKMLADAMYATDKMGPFLTACDNAPVTASIWFLNPPWGNWQPGSDPPRSRHHNVYALAGGLRSQGKDLRVAAYTNALVDDASDIFRDMPSHIVKNRDGTPYSASTMSDSGRRPSYYIRIHDPAVRDYWINMHTSRLKEWKLDFHYTDGPGLMHELPDWEARQVTQGYDWIDYLLKLRTAIQEIRPDAVIFSNGPKPGSDIYYVEWRDHEWRRLGSANWHELAADLLFMRLTMPPDRVMVLTYGSDAAEPAFSSYMVLYGSPGHLNKAWRIPWMHAAMRTRGARPRPGVLSEPWYQNGKSTVETMLFEAPDGGILINLLAHPGAPDTWKIRFDAKSAGLKPGLNWKADLLISPPAGKDAADLPRTVSYQLPVENCPEQVELVIPLVKSGVVSLKLSQEEK